MPILLVTGASRGLGLEFTRQYAADGWNVIACCRDPGKANDLQALGQQHQTIRIEALAVTDRASIAALAQRLKDTAIDLLINNAGIYGDHDHQDFGRLDAAIWAEVLATNTIAPVMLTEALLENLRRGNGKKAVFISSLMGSIADSSGGAIIYRTSKAALNAAMRQLSFALKADGIATASLHPGWVQTDMGGKQAPVTPPQSITGMRQVIDGLTLAKTGGFFAYDGRELPW